MKITKIYHIADIHHRLYTRQEEYRLVFEKLFNDIKLRGTDNALIIILGDVVHAKTDVSPELMFLVTDFLRGCADLCPTILIPGNHDFNESNKSKLDALTPIVHAMRHPNLKYSLNSEVFSIGDITFSHLSIWDGKENWKLANQIEGNRKVALYHGPVVGAMTDIGFDQFLNALPIEVFDGFDCALLGDIHKQQNLGGKNIVYPGSLIQQDYGESVTGHGFVVWDMDTVTPAFVEIPNEYAQYTYTVKNGEVTDLDIQNLSNKSSVRLLYESTPPDKLKEIVDTFTSKFGIKNVALSEIRQKFQISTAATEHVENIFKSWDINSQNVLFKEYFESVKDIPDDDIFRDMLKLHRDLSVKYTSGDTLTGVTWAPISFEFSNMFSYGENNILNAAELRGLCGLFAPNRSGKSNLLDSLIFTIYDKCTRTSLAAYVMNRDSDTFYGKFTFRIGENDYTISRSAKRGSKGNVSVKVDFIHHTAMGDVSLNGKSRDDTNKVIRKYLGSYDDFIMTTMNTQSDPRSFIDMAQKDRKDVLYKFIDIDRYGLQSNEAKVMSKESQGVIKILSAVNYVEAIAAQTQKILDSESGMLTLQTEISKIEEENAQLTAKIEAMNLDNIDEAIDINKVNTDIQNTSQSILVNQNNIATQTQNLVKLNEDLAQITPVIQSVDVAKIDAEIVSYESIITSHSLVEREYSMLNVEIQHLQSKVDKLATHKYDPNCKYCVQNQFVIDAEQAKKTLQEKLPQLNELKVKLDGIDVVTAKSSLASIREKKKLYSDLVMKETVVKSSIQTANNTITNSNLLIASANDKLITLNEKVKRYNENLNSTLENERKLKEKQQLTTARQINVSKMNSLNAQREQYVISVASAKQYIERLDSDQKKLTKTQREFEVYERYIQATSRDGIPYMILKNVIPIIELEVNEVLALSTTFKINLELEDSDINGYIVSQDGERWPIELASGMEKFIISTAIRSSLVRLSGLPKPNFLLIDEGFGVLDADNIRNIVSVLNHLKTKFSFILCVSHIVELRDYVDKILTVSKTGGKSVLSDTN